MSILYFNINFMAKDILKRPEVTFYLYNKKDDKLRVTPSKIITKFNVKTKWYETDNFNYHDPSFVIFEKWIFVLKLENVWTEIAYDQIFEFLSFYNNKWWILTKWSKQDWTHIKNGLRVDARKFPCYVTMEKIIKDEKETVIVKEEVKVSTIPRKFAKQLSYIQLADLCKNWKITIPDDIEKNAGTSDELKGRYIKLLDWRLTD